MKRENFYVDFCNNRQYLKMTQKTCSVHKSKNYLVKVINTCTSCKIYDKTRRLLS